MAAWGAIDALPVRSALTGQQLCQLNVPAMSTVGDLKGAIEMATGIPRQEQLLTALGRPLVDEDFIKPSLALSKDRHLALLRRGAAYAAELESRRQALKHIAASGRLSELTLEQRGDPEVVLAAVASNVTNLRDATDDIQRDPEVMLNAIHLHSMASCYAHPELWCDRDFALGAVRADGELFTQVAERFKDDAQVVLAAVEHDGHLLKHASFACRGLREVALAAVQQKGTALSHIAGHLKNNKEIAIAALGQDGMAFCHIGQKLRQDRDVRRAARFKDGRPMFDDDDGPAAGARDAVVSEN